jgi:hypothetical protein
MTSLRSIAYTRKPARWSDVYTTIPARRIGGSDLPHYEARDLGIEHAPLQDFRSPVAEKFFLLAVGEQTYLVNTAGANYARYATLVLTDR